MNDDTKLRREVGEDTHTHTHTYIYIYIILVTYRASRPIRRCWSDARSGESHVAVGTLTSNAIPHLRLL